MNYYEILKVSKHANEEEIKSSYKALVKKYHPDLYVGDKDFAEKKIKEINEAYKILSDPETKKEYDNYLNPPIEQNVYQTYQPKYDYNQSKYSDYQQQTNDENKQNTVSWSLTQFITNKINNLDSKQQLRVFIFTLVFLFALLLINLIEIKSYLETGKSPFQMHKQNTNSINTTQDDFDNDYYKYDSNDDNEDYYEDNFDLDEFFNQLFEEYKQYKDNFYEDSNISDENNESL